jgi:hypothetical protein
MMSPDELRALADALEPMAAAPRFDCLPVVEFCAWLRQCAEQRSVAYKHTEPDGSVAYFGADEAPCEKCVPLYAAPAAPQHADRCRSSETPSSKATSAASPERQALNLEDAAAQVAAGSGEQAEPKREPLSDDWIIDTANEIHAALPFDAVADRPRSRTRARNRRQR